MSTNSELVSGSAGSKVSSHFSISARVTTSPSSMVTSSGIEVSLCFQLPRRK